MGKESVHSNTRNRAGKLRVPDKESHAEIHCGPQRKNLVKSQAAVPVFNKGLVRTRQSGPGRVQKTTPHCALLCAAFLATSPAQAAEDIYQFSLEELITMEITSVSRRSQPLAEAAAAIHVITQEDIRRSGMTSIPELLRMVPGLHVANMDANKWAISSRGFNGRWSNKLLVLIDGRSVYTPLFSGVYWDEQDTLLEDIDRIEVIRGPGGTLWGANAVNGVINIITRNGRDTQDSLLAVRAGDLEQGLSFRHGGAIGDKGWFRVFAKAAEHDGFGNPSKGESFDAWDNQRAGFRVDWEPGAGDALTVQGDIFNGNSGQTTGYLQDILSTATFAKDTIDLDGGNLLVRWNHDYQGGSAFELQAYIDQSNRHDLSLDQRITTFDLDFLYRLQASERQQISWGMGYRRIEDDIEASFTVSFDPASTIRENYSAFIHDEIALRDDLQLTLGTKLEYNDFSDFEYQPNIRLRWLTSEDHTVWGAVSRAVRTPSRSDQDIRINSASFSSPFVDPDGPGPLPTGAPTLISILGNKMAKSETVVAYELGYRGQPASDFSLDVVAFHNDYSDLIASRTNFLLETTPGPAHAVISNQFENESEGESYGLEIAANWQLAPNWRVHTSYTWQKLKFELDPLGNDANIEADREETLPEQQFKLRSEWNIRENLELDAFLYHVDSIKARQLSGGVSIPSYQRLDIRLAWRPSENVEISLAGQNLLESEHAEYYTVDLLPSEVQRSVYGQIKYTFK